MLGFLLWSALALFLIFLLRVHFYGPAREEATLNPRVQRLCNWIMCAEIRDHDGDPVLHVHPPMQADRLMLVWVNAGRRRVSILVQDAPHARFTKLTDFFTSAEHRILAAAVKEKIKGFAGALKQRQSQAYAALFSDLEPPKET